MSKEKNQKIYDQLLKELGEKQKEFLEKENELAENVKGFGDMVVLEKYLQAKALFQKSWNNYFSFLKVISDGNKNR